MRVENEPANICFLQDRFQIRIVSAFRQPKAGGLDTEKIHIDIASNQNLGPRCCSRGH